MNTNKCIYKLAINLVCVMVFLMMPLCSFATEQTEVEIKPPVIQEEHKITEKKSQNLFVHVKTIPVKKPDSVTCVPQTDKTQEETNVVKTPVDIYGHLVNPNYKFNEPKYEKKEVLSNESTTYCLLLKYINKIDSLLKNSRFNKNIIVKKIINELGRFEQRINRNYTIATIDYAPYYFIMPSFSNDFLKNIVFSADIKNIMELLPYNLTIQKKTIYKMNPPENVITSDGITDMLVLINAPSPQIKVMGKSRFAKLVVDIRNNTLYKYDKNGFPLKAYLVATGASGTRTMSGLRVVTYKERFPYAGDPTSKRAQDPYSYGPYIIFLNVVEPKTGKQYVIEQLLHGNGNEYSIGKKVSHGCIRTSNYVMKNDLSREVKRGDYVLLINPDVY